MGDVVFAEDRKILCEFFTQALDRPGPKAVGYGSRESQEARFRALTQIGSFPGRSILDVGCGLGHLFSFLTRGSVPARYMGIDINGCSILCARKSFPNVEFEVHDLLLQPLQKKFDWVLASGIFNIKTPNCGPYTLRTLEAMFKVCTRGIGVNFVRPHPQCKRNAQTRYSDPAKVLDFVCQFLSSNVVLRADYLPNDFTIFVYKDKL